MNKSANTKVRTNVYLDATIKKEAQDIFKKYGMGLSDAFNIFLAQSVMQRGIPFDIKIPSEETLQTIKDARAGKNMSKISMEELKKEINAWYSCP